MRQISIEQELNSSATEMKSYLSLYDKAGHEIGVGKKGSYDGHSHLFFYDLIFAPQGIISIDSMEIKQNISLIIVPPKAYLPEIELGNFFF